jgi:hypothetical protein
MSNKIYFFILAIMLFVLNLPGCGGSSGIQIATGNVNLTWDAPTTRSDGSMLNPVSDLSMYIIYYGTSPHTFTICVVVANPGVTTISKTLNLSPGTYYFAVTAVDTLGQESSYSNEISKTI